MKTEIWKIRFISGRILHYLTCSIIFIFLAGPFIWFLSVSLRKGEDVFTFSLIPENPTLENYRYVWEYAGMERAFVNSIFVTVLTIAGNVLLASMAAYPLARYQFKGRNIILFVILSTMMVPFQLMMIPLFDIVRFMGLYDTLWALILPSSVGAFTIFLIRQAYLTIPRDIEESARLDGAGEIRIWWQIMLPLVKPALATLAIFVFVFTWGDFMWPLIILQSEDKFTLPLQVASLMGTFSADYHYLAAASIIGIIPVFVLFLFLQRYFIKGIFAGSIK